MWQGQQDHLAGVEGKKGERTAWSSSSRSSFFFFGAFKGLSLPAGRDDGEVGDVVGEPDAGEGSSRPSGPGRDGSRSPGLTRWKTRRTAL